MTIENIIGIAILAAVFVFLFTITAMSEGFLHAAMLWGLSLALTGVIYVGVILAVG